jgi:hypothetical protein
VSPGELLELARATPEVTELVAFVQSDAFVALRQALVGAPARAS